MKTFATVTIALVLLFCAPAAAFAQSVGDYRSAATGNWSAASTWQRYDGANWVVSGTPSGSGVITVQSADSVFVDVAVSVTGILANQGRLGGTGSLTIADGGTYEHAEINGSLPVCTWADGSTCLVTGYTTGSKPNNGNQNFFNFTWNCPNQVSNVDVGMSGNTIRGNITVINTGVSRVYLTSPGSYTFGQPITITGDVHVVGGQFASNGSSSPDTIEVISLGDIIVTGGNFSLSRGSAPDVTWKLSGDFLVSNATLQNSGGFHLNKLIFTGSVTHALDLSNVTYGGGTSYFTMEVDSGSTLDAGTTVISSSNSGSFILKPGATLATAHAAGVGGLVQCTGVSNGGGNVLSKDASYTFNGTASQITSTMMPDSVFNLTINNASGVTLTQTTNIDGTLHLMAGVLDNTVGFTLGPIGSVSYEGGSLLIPVAVGPDGGTVPASYSLGQNYPNPFNPLTIVPYELSSAGFVTLGVYNALGAEVATLVRGSVAAGTHTATWDASGMPSGVYYYRLLVAPEHRPGFSGLKTMVLVK